MTSARYFVDEASNFTPLEKEKWQDGAVCATTDPEVFFPPTGKNVYAAARKICNSCDVRLKCLAYIMRVEGESHSHNRYGMYAGLSPVERRKLYEEQRDLAEITDPIVKV